MGFIDIKKSINIKKRIKKLISAAVSFVIAAGCFGLIACGENKSDSLSIVCTIFPEYDWVSEILGDKKDSAELSFILDGGVDLHSYRPTAQDLAEIYTSDLFIYVGGESDEWVDSALKNAPDKNLKTINLLQVLGDKAKIEQDFGGESEDHDHGDGGHDHEEDHEGELDEHVWLSLKNTQIFCDKIAAELCALDPENATVYKNNLASYKNKLAALDERYSEFVKTARFDTLVFGDRFPFSYLAGDYNINCFAAFSGCSAESEASFEKIVFLASKIDELNLPAVCKTENVKQKIAEQVKENTKSKNQKIVSFDSLQSTSADDVKNGKTYLSAMEKNLDSLMQALGE